MTKILTLQNSIISHLKITKSMYRCLVISDKLKFDKEFHFQHICNPFVLLINVSDGLLWMFKTFVFKKLICRWIPILPETFMTLMSTLEDGPYLCRFLSRFCNRFRNRDEVLLFMVTWYGCVA